MVFTCFSLGRARKKLSFIISTNKTNGINDSTSRYVSKDYEKEDNCRKNAPNDKNVLSENALSTNTSPPDDKFFLIFFIFLYLGMSATLNAYYIFSANDYWMWKFRNTSIPWAGAAGAENRTDLQATVFSFILLANAVPALISLVLIVPIIKATRTRPRIYVCFSIFIMVYILYFLLALLDTDSLQTQLAIVVLLLAALNSGVSVTLLASCLTQVAHFSQTIVKAYTIGDGSAAMVTSIIQILCLLIGRDSQVSGLIYFGMGTIIFLVALILYIMTTNSKYYSYHINETNQNSSKLKPTVADFKIAVKDVWPIIAVYGCCIIGLNMDNISSLIVSEYRDNGTDWAEKYFVPVITMCLGNAFGVLGRICSWNLITHKNYLYILAINVVRAVIFLPLYIGCNAYPRTLPVWFPHDWQYVIIMIAFTFSNGFFTTSCVLSIPNFMTGKVPTEIYYLLLQITLSAVSFCTSPLNIVVVKYIL